MFSRKMDPVALSIAEILDKNKEVREQTAKLNREFRVERESQVNPFDRSAYDSRLQEINESIDSNVKPKKSPLTENILKRLADLYLDEDMKSFDDLARTVELDEDRLDEVGDTTRGRRALADVLGRAVSRLNDPEERTKLRKSNKTDKTINAKYNARMRLVHGSDLYDYGHFKKDAEGKTRISPYKRPKKYNDWKAWATGRKPHGWFEEELSAEKDSKTLDEGHGMFRANTYGKNNEAENDGKKYKIVRFLKKWRKKNNI